MQRSLVVGLLSFLCACGVDPGPSGGGGGSSGTGGGSSSSSSASFCCSINSTSYDCPNQAAVEKCANLSNPDPSDCTRRSARCN
ncbi:MAG: hypothetical protein MUC96_19745 [Myxococcaceae bacterium]|jgi:hypothetical protein|nr:hypothetical protein [Myxococcaceae bacterium]